MKSTYLYAFILCVLSLLGMSSARASVFYAVGTSATDFSSDIYVVTNIATGTIFKIGESGKSLTDAAFHAGTRRLYGIDSAGQLYSIDLGTGLATRISTSGQGTMYALEFCGDTLYGWGSSNLVTYNLSTGVASPVGPVGFAASGDLACQADGKLFGTARSSVSGNPDSLIRINRISGAGTVMGVMAYPQVFGLDFDLDGTLYAATQPINSGGIVQFFRVDANNGQTLEVLGTQTDAVGMYGFAIDTEDGTGCSLLESPHTDYFRDEDGDGYGTDSGDSADTVRACLPPQGYVANDEDCDDLDEEISPEALEICDGIDNDCDGGVDVDAVDAPAWYRDLDGDGFGVGQPLYECSKPVGYTSKPGDCNDSSAQTHPGAQEICNGLDDDCDGVADNGLSFNSYYRDVDQDGYGNTLDTVATCSGVPSGYVVTAGDCNDQNAQIHPGAAEVCDGTDNDCDGKVDEGAGSFYYKDADGDTWGRVDQGEVGDVVLACAQPAGYVSRSEDCNDDDATVYPGAVELCDNKDNDCDAQVDEDPADPSAWYLDQDGDLFGGSSSPVFACQAPVSHVAVNGDCDDLNASVYPGADEVLDGQDNNCDGQVDEGFETPTATPGPTATPEATSTPESTGTPTDASPTPNPSPTPEATPLGEDTPDGGDEPAGGCSCDSGEGSGSRSPLQAGTLLLLALVILRRRIR